MPTIPTYNGPQVRQAAVEGGYQQNIDVSSGLNKLAQGLGNLGDAADRADLQNATIAAQGAEAKIRSAWYQTDQKLRQEFSGDKIGGYQPAVDAWWKSAPQEYGQELTPRAQFIASKSLVSAAEMAQRTSALHTFTATDDLAKQRAADAITLEQNSAVADVNKTGKPDTAAVYAANIIEKNKAEAVLRNWTPEALALKNLKDTTTLHTSVISAMQVNSPGAAKAYFDYVKGDATQFAPTAVDNVERILKPLADAQVAGTAARDVFGSLMDGKPLTAEIPYKEADAALVKQFGNDPSKLAAARQELDRQVGVWNKSQSEHEAGAIESVFKLKNSGMSSAQMQRTADWQNMSAKNQAMFKKQWQDEADASLSRSVNRMALLERQKEMLAAPTMLQYAANPEALAKMTPAEITQLAPTIGSQNAQHLLTTSKAYQGNQAKLSEARVDNDMFESIAASVSIDPKPKSSDAEATRKVWNLRQQVETAVGQQQMQAKRELTRSEKEKVMQDIVHQQVLIPGWFSDTAVVPATLSPADLAKTSVKFMAPVGPRGASAEKVLPLSDIPINEYAAVEAKLKQYRQAASPSDVAREWYLFKNKK